MKASQSTVYSFFDQFFFFLLLLGLVPATLFISDIIVIESLAFAEFFAPDSDSSAEFKQSYETLQSGFSLSKEIRYLLLGLFGFALLACSIWFVQRQQKKKLWYLVHAYLLVWITLIAFSILGESSSSNGKQLAVLLTLGLGAFYLIFCIISAIYFIKNGSVRSKSFFWAFLITALVYGFPDALFFGSIALFLRVIYLIIEQNVQTVQSLSGRRLLFVFLKSLLFWLPLLLFVIPGEKLTNTIYESSINGIYSSIFQIEKEEGSERGFEKPEFHADLKSWLDERFAPLEGETLNARFAAIEKNIKAQTNGLNQLSDEQSKAVPQMIAGIYYEETEQGMKNIKPYFEEEKCGWHILLPTSCCIMNGMKSYLFTMVKRWRKELGRTIEKNVADALRGAANEMKNGSMTGQEGILASLEKNKQDIEQEIQELKNNIEKTIMGVYNGILLVNLIMDLLLFFLIVKSFLVVFARVAFSGRDEIYVTLLDPNQEMQKGNLKKWGNEYVIRAEDQLNFYTSRAYEPSGRPPKFVIPQKTAAFFSRLRTGNYALNHIVMREREGSVYYHALGGTEFVEWNLEEGEEVIFNLENFIAMSEGVKLSVQYSFRLTSLLLGRLRFMTAKGPGKLVLVTKGTPITSEEEQGNASVPVSRIIAFQKNTRFHVHSELNVVDVFLSGVYLEKKPGDLILIDADEKGNVKSGISRFIKGFLLPI